MIGSETSLYFFDVSTTSFAFNFMTDAPYTILPYVNFKDICFSSPLLH